MTARANLWSRLGPVMVAVGAMGVFAWSSFVDRPRPGDIVAQSNFAAQYARTWEVLALYSNCGVKRSIEVVSPDVAEVQAAYAAMRKEVAGSGYDTQARIIDRQFQLFAQPRSDLEIVATDICDRAAYLSPVTKAQVLSSIAATRRLATD